MSKTYFYSLFVWSTVASSATHVSIYSYYTEDIAYFVKINANFYGPVSKGLNPASNSSLHQGIVVPKNVFISRHDGERTPQNLYYDYWA